ncbi:MAG TPA: hypothetical protein GXX57_04090 [Firmicutes bacterium]|nr:hypothetical protein [Bacillota bacterium]
MWWRRYEDNSLYIDYFPPSTITLSDGFKLTLKTDYPENGELLLEIEKAPGKEIPIYLRVPAWSSVESVEVTGNPLEPTVTSGYICCKNSWKTGDVMRIRLAMPSYEIDTFADDKVAKYVGPMLLVQPAPQQLKPMLASYRLWLSLLHEKS